MTKIKELRIKSERELMDFLKESRLRLAELSAKAALKQLKDVRSIRSLRRDIARVLTMLREKRLL